MPFEIVTSSTATLHWTSGRSRKRVSVQRLLDEVGMTIAMVREYGTKGMDIGGKPFGLNRIDFLVERGCLKRMIPTLGNEDDFNPDPYEATSLADLVAARQELLDMLAKYPPVRSKTGDFV